MAVRRIAPAILFALLLAGWLGALLMFSHQLDKENGAAMVRVDRAQRLLASIISEESGERAYLETGDNAMLTPSLNERAAFDALLDQELSRTTDAELRDDLVRQQAAARAWERLATRDNANFREVLDNYPEHLRPREDAIAAFNRVNEIYRDDVERKRERTERALMLRVIALVVGLSAMIGGAALLLLRRRGSVDRRYADSQAEFASAMQSSVDDREADALLKRHLERSIADDATVTVLRRDDEADRLLAGTQLDPDSPLAITLSEARPRDCLAIRRGTRYVQADKDPLVACEVCGATGPTSCQPLLVGDRIIGSVLIERERPVRGRTGDRVVDDSLAQAAPILAGLRTLALAQSRAMTDALTGLPNRWALQDALRRMLAQSSRNRTPLALVLLDLDHFKHLNDTHGHDAGDQALSAVGAALLAALRDSDLPTRSGGEEFAVLLPDTPIDGAMAVAEQLRAAVAAIELPIEGVSLTTSVGVAALPLHAVDADSLMRAADRALYAAKRAGRDRVEIAAAHQADPFPALAALPDDLPA
ncbi:MAG TPA: GGDEF domain-containing protein [Conexibacter sp.]